MKEHSHPIENPFAIAVHEAGHLVVGVAFGRKIDRVSLDRIDDKRGCFFTPVGQDEWDDFEEVCTLLAGPRAQVELAPDSLTSGQHSVFQQRIIHPMTEPKMIPAEVYDYLGWDFDIRPIYRRLCVPLAWAHNMPFGVTHVEVIEYAETQVLGFMRDPLVRTEMIKIANVILQQRKLSGSDAVSLVAGSGVLEIANRDRWFLWGG